ncbi:hypothetical protein GUITHDRAFT_102513 [Guillardia theta CCMP2712]|uniref:Uncharacterized protein n=1 Tax=Guillardia theta (strain CCMP2712) TaxID=905079 RepID=L1JUM5_GUITC|nr:hypothetical protein GUITHDRAFT_102513 [Guillardia theta CCMP2712]EKX51900.1 hypothetical protein GUITHDRAFT_102513 [Guillardia theta CCMP2712]|eukprot:XP_005838880.1 hypothetical protein GUITHDRAFT_102513 [Guillardia theta CCMP2712]
MKSTSNTVLTDEEIITVYSLRSKATSSGSLTHQAAAGRSAVVAEMFKVSPNLVRDLWARKVYREVTLPYWTEREKVLSACEELRSGQTTSLLALPPNLTKGKAKNADKRTATVNTSIVIEKQNSFKDSSPIERKEAVSLNDQETNKRRLVADNAHVPVNLIGNGASQVPFEARPRGLRASPQVEFFPAPSPLASDSFLPVKRGHDDTHRAKFQPRSCPDASSYLPSVEINDSPEEEGVQHNSYFEDLIFSSKPQEGCSNLSSAYEELCSVEISAEEMAGSSNDGRANVEPNNSRFDGFWSGGANEAHHHQTHEGTIKDAAATRPAQSGGSYYNKVPYAHQDGFFDFDSSVARYDHAECCSPALSDRQQFDMSESMMRNEPLKQNGSTAMPGSFYCSPAPPSCKAEQSTQFFDQRAWTAYPPTNAPSMSGLQEERGAAWDRSASCPSYSDNELYAQSLNSATSKYLTGSCRWSSLGECDSLNRRFDTVAVEQLQSYI